MTAIICGVALLTIGFFIGQSTASGWVANPAVATKGRIVTLSAGLLFGIQRDGLIGGWFWSAGQWPAVAAFVIALLALAFAADLVLLRWRSL